MRKIPREIESSRNIALGGTFWEAASPEVDSVRCGRAEESEPDKTDSSKIKMRGRISEIHDDNANRQVGGNRQEEHARETTRNRCVAPQWRREQRILLNVSWETLVEGDWQSYPRDKPPASTSLKVSRFCQNSTSSAVG